MNLGRLLKDLDIKPSAFEDLYKALPKLSSNDTSALIEALTPEQLQKLDKKRLPPNARVYLSHNTPQIKAHKARMKELISLPNVGELSQQTAEAISYYTKNPTELLKAVAENPGGLAAVGITGVMAARLIDTAVKVVQGKYQPQHAQLRFDNADTQYPEGFDGFAVGQEIISTLLPVTEVLGAYGKFASNRNLVVEPDEVQAKVKSNFIEGVKYLVQGSDAYNKDIGISQDYTIPRANELRSSTKPPEPAAITATRAAVKAQSLGVTKPATSAPNPEYLPKNTYTPPAKEDDYWYKHMETLGNPKLIDRSQAPTPSVAPPPQPSIPTTPTPNLIAQRRKEVMQQMYSRTTPASLNTPYIQAREQLNDSSTKAERDAVRDMGLEIHRKANPSLYN